MYLIAAGPGGHGGPPTLWCLLWVLLLLGGLIAAGLWWSRRRHRSGSPSNKRPNAPGGGSTGHANDEGRSAAEDILAERYARGDINDEEYMQRQSVLRDERRNNT